MGARKLFCMTIAFCPTGRFKGPNTCSNIETSEERARSTLTLYFGPVICLVILTLSACGMPHWVSNHVCMARTSFAIACAVSHDPHKEERREQRQHFAVQNPEPRVHELPQRAHASSHQMDISSALSNLPGSI